MAVLDVAKKVATKVGLPIPDKVIAATDRQWVELTNLLNEVADDIAGAYDWQVLRGIHTLDGDGVAVGFDLPADYDRMLITASVWTSRYSWAMNHVVDGDRWLELLTLPYRQAAGSWTIYGNQINILDVLAPGETAKFFYVSNAIVAPAIGANQSTFKTDTDKYRLSEKTLMLGTVAKWRQQKGQVYDADLAAFNIDLAAEIEKDGGSKPIISGRRGVNWRSPNVAWPGAVTGSP